MIPAEINKFGFSVRDAFNKMNACSLTLDDLSETIPLLSRVNYDTQICILEMLLFNPGKRNFCHVGETFSTRTLVINEAFRTDKFLTFAHATSLKKLRKTCRATLNNCKRFQQQRKSNCATIQNNVKY